MGIPIVDGRGFAETDDGALDPVAMVNETIVRTFWQDQQPDRPARAAGFSDATRRGSPSSASPRT